MCPAQIFVPRGLCIDDCSGRSVAPGAPGFLRRSGYHGFGESTLAFRSHNFTSFFFFVFILFSLFSRLLQISAVEAALDRLAGLRQELEELWATRKLRLELCLRLRVFERDALEASGQLEMWAQELQGSQREGSPEQLLRVHNDGVAHMQNTAFQVLQQGQELAQVRNHHFLPS